MMLSRRRALLGAASLAVTSSAGVAAISTGLVGCGPITSVMTRHYLLDLRRDSRVPIPLRVAVITDTHLCDPWSPLSMLEGLLDLARGEEPDLLVWVGDYGARDSMSAIPKTIIDEREIARVAGSYIPRLGAYAALGNHDWTDHPDILRDGGVPPIVGAFERAGIATLRNETIPLIHEGRRFDLSGVDSFFIYSPALGGTPGSYKTLPKEASPDRAHIMLAHEPDIFETAWGCGSEHVDLFVSGHTHGGQANIFGWRPTPKVSAYGDKYAHGLHSTGSSSLIVSAGIGYGGAPLRLGVPPEIVIIDAII